MNRSESRALARVRTGDPWAVKVYEEGLLLTLLGLLDQAGDVHCRECDAVVVRSENWEANFVCGCGWRLEEMMA